MKLWLKFETVQVGLLNRDSVPPLDVCLGDLLHEEQRLATQLSITPKTVPSADVNVTNVAQGREDNQQCFSCKGYGHIAHNCLKKVCNYCKKAGHFLKDCRVQLLNHQSQAFQADVQLSSSASPATVSTDSSGLTPAMCLKSYDW